MPKLILQFEDRVLKEFPLGPQILKIGRLPDNAVCIDNPAMSSHHARVFREGGYDILEDLGSTNGTFVNNQRITRHTLKNGDVVQVGKHKLVYDAAAADAAAEAGPTAPEPMLPELGGTVFLDTKQQKELLAKMAAQAQAEPGAAAAAPVKPLAAPPTPTKLGVLRVLAGRADQQEYALEAHTSLIGKSDTALVRLKGWFKPKVALAIGRKGEGYTATPLGGKTLINNQPLQQRQELKDGDVLQVSGLTLEFKIKA